MSNIVNAINCLGAAKNTQPIQCAIDPKFINGALIVPKGTVITTTTYSAFQTALLAGMQNVNKTSRFFPVYNFENGKFENESKVVQKTSIGSQHVVREGFNNWMWQFFTGGLNMLQALRAFNGANWDFFLWDNDPAGNKFMGLVNSGGLRAIPTDAGYIWADPFNPNDGGSKLTEYWWGAVFNQQVFTDNLGVIQAPTSIVPSLNYPGLTDANLSIASVNATKGSFNISVTNNAGVDLGALNSTALAVTTLWNGAVTSGGAALTVSGVVWVPSTTTGVPGYFTVSFATTSPYPASTGTNLTINLGSVTALVAAGMNLESSGALTSVPSN